MQEQVSRPRVLSCAETATLVRRALKDAFPGQRFSVRSQTYAGGASIHVRYVDGPTQKQVERVTDRFTGGRFDGMVDLAYHVKSWLMPNGDAIVARDPGSGVTSGHSYPAPSPDAELVSFGADHIFAERTLSAELTAKIESIVEEATGESFNRDAMYSFAHNGRVYNGWGSQIVWQISTDMPV